MIVTPEYNIGYTLKVETAESIGLIRGKNASGRNIAVMGVGRTLACWTDVANYMRSHYALVLDQNDAVVSVLYHKGTLVSSLDSNQSELGCTVDADLKVLGKAADWLASTLAEKLTRTAPRLAKSIFKNGRIVRIKPGCPALDTGAYAIVKAIYRGIEVSMLDVQPIGKKETVRIAARYAEVMYPTPHGNNIKVLARIYAHNVNWLHYGREGIPLTDVWDSDLLYPKQPITIVLNGAEMNLLARNGPMPGEPRTPMLAHKDTGDG